MAAAAAAAAAAPGPPACPADGENSRLGEARHNCVRAPTVEPVRDKGASAGMDKSADETVDAVDPGNAENDGGADGTGAGPAAAVGPDLDPRRDPGAEAAVAGDPAEVRRWYGRGFGGKATTVCPVGPCGS